MLRSAIACMLPPRPPSPPSGPPRGTYFSRRNETAPLPPSPAMTSIFASSMNFIYVHHASAGIRSRGSGGRRRALEQQEAFGVVAAPVALPDLLPRRIRRRIAVVATHLQQQRRTRIRGGEIVPHRDDTAEVLDQCALRLAQISAGKAGHPRRQLLRQRFGDRAVAAPGIQIRQPD